MRQCVTCLVCPSVALSLSFLFKSLNLAFASVYYILGCFSDMTTVSVLCVYDRWHAAAAQTLAAYAAVVCLQ